MPSNKLKKSFYRIQIDPEFRRTVGRAAPGSIERLQYLESLVNELCVTKVLEYKQQVIVANLGNFAHDPRNCPHLIGLDVHQILIEVVREHLQLISANPSGKKSSDYLKLITLAVAGICNLVTSSQNIRLHFSHNPQNIFPLFDVIQHPLVDAECLANCLTIFINLCAPSVHLQEQDCVYFEPNCSTTAFNSSVKTQFPVVVTFARNILSGNINSEDPRLRILSKIFLTDSFRHFYVCLKTHVRLCYASRHCSNIDVTTSNSSPRLNSTYALSLVNSFTPSTTVLGKPVQSKLLTPARCTQKPQSLVGWVGVWAALSKARLTGLVVSTALAGCALAAPSPLVCGTFLAHPAASLLALVIGTTLTSASANSINQIMEVQYDALMRRTQMRPLVRKVISPVGACVFASITATLGLAILLAGTNTLVASLAAGNILLYTCVYTPLKRVSQVNTWVGSVVGAIPPIMGWATATGSIDLGSLVLAGLLYTWQFPHFMSLSWLARNEYDRAGYVMTSIVDPQLARAVALRHSFTTTAVCFLASDGINWVGGLATAPFNIALIYYSWRFYRAPIEDQGLVKSDARRLFRASLIHLPVVMSVLLICSFCGDFVA
nr:protoheme IX farnesyltransferase [Hymenolepis microstoma]